jgi:hypothetical protein
MTGLPPESAGWSRRETCLSGSTYRVRAQAGALRDGWSVVVNSWPESDFANPFLRQAGTDRPGMVRRYRQWLADQPDLLRRIREGELTGRALGCWCAPEPCHADVLTDEVNRVQRRPG